MAEADTIEPAEPPAPEAKEPRAPKPDAAKPKAAEPVNYFDRFDTDADAGDGGLGERWRLNQTESYYRGTLRGSANLSTLASIHAMRKAGASEDEILAKLPTPMQGVGDEFFATPAEALTARRKFVADKAAEYEKIVADLARYDLMQPFSNPGEAVTALTGQLSGGLQSPESFLGAASKGASVLIRTGKAALQQAGIMAVTDPVVQANNIAAQTQKEYEPSRHAMAIGMGAVLGGGLHLATGELVPMLRVKRTVAEAAAEDPSFARADIPAEPVRAEPATPVEPGAGAAAEHPAVPGGEAQPPGASPQARPASPIARDMYAPPDPLDLAMSGRLSADESLGIAERLIANHQEIENRIFGNKDVADEWRKLHRQSDRAWDNADDAKAKAIDERISELEKKTGITPEQDDWLNGGGWPEHTNPDDWKELSRNLRDIENGREDAVGVSAGELRYVPSTNDWNRMAGTERNAVITVLTAMNEEAKAGRDVKVFLRDVANERIKRYGGGADALEVTENQIERLANFLREGVKREGTAAPVAMPQIAHEPTRDSAAPRAPEAAQPGEVAPAAAPEPVIHRVATPDGKSVDVKPTVIEAKDIITSGDAGYDTGLQPRDRSRAASEQQIREMAANLDPERLGHSTEADRGAPIVGPDSMVESGNGRVMAIRQAYAEGGEAAARYRKWLEGEVEPEVLAGFKEPVIVRQRVTEMTPEERRAFTVSANQSATLTMSAPERALADSRLIGGDALDMIRNPDDLGAVGNRDFVRVFISKLPQSEQGAMMNAEGGLSAEGLTRVRNAVLARAYGDVPVLARIAEATADDVKSISIGLVSVAPHWAKLRSDIEAGLVRPDIDQTAALVEAVTRTADLRAKGTKLDAFLAQQDAFDRLPSQVEAFMRMFYDPSGRKAAGANRIADALRFYAEEGRKISGGGLDLGLPPVSVADLQRLAREKAQHGGQSTEGTLFLRAGAGDGKGGRAPRGEVQGQGPREGGAGPGGAGAGRDSAGTGHAPGDELALAARQSGTTLAMERARPDAGISTEPPGAATGTAVATVPDLPSPAQETALRSLQQQAFDFADAIGFPLREGRVKRGALGIYNQSTGVVRVKEVPDFEVVSHEAGHAIEAKVGGALTDLTNHYPTELAPLVSNPGAYDPSLHVKEGFAEYVRRYIGNPAHAEQVAPGFTIAFRDFMARNAPDVMHAIDNAGAAYRAYLEAPSVDVLGAVRRSRAENVEGWRSAVAQVREEGFPAVVRSVMQKGYAAIFDDKAPVTRAVRDMARAISERTGEPVDLKAVDNPDTLFRLFARSQQAAMLDMTDGVRPYHGVTPDGPSLHDAMAKATGAATVFGKWNPELKASFSDFLIARRAVVLWDKFTRGDLPNPPTPFSKGDAVTAMADLERAFPQFREASDMVHAWTRQLLKKQYEGGLIGRDLFDKLSREEFYVPFMRDLSDKPLASGDVAKAGGRDRVASTIEKMRGSSRDIKDPIESLMMQAFLVNRTLQHNDVIRALVRLGKEAGPEGGRYVEPLSALEGKKYTFDLAESIERLARERGVPPDDIKLVTGALTDVFGHDPLVGSFFRMEPAGKRGEPIVFYKEGGEMRVARLMAEQEGHALYETLTALPAHLTDGFSELVATSSSVLRTGIVTNPMFAITNYIRDQFAVGILRSDYIPMASGLPGIKAEFGQGEAAKLYAYGGGMASGTSIAPVERAIKADIDALAKKGYLVNRLTSFKGLLDLASFTEAGTRNSVFAKVYEAKKAQGLSEYESMIEAAFQSTDILDFSRHGSRTLAIRNYLPFLNAHFQGVDKAKRTILDPLLQKMTGDQVFASDKEAFNNAMLAVVKVFGVGGMLGAGWAAINAGSEAYRDTSPAIKGTHVVIPWGRNIVLWPKPFELGVGFTAGEYAYQRLVQDDPRAAEQFAKAAWQALEPPNPMQDIPILKTYFELKSGKNLFTGTDIVPDRLQRLAPAQQFHERTSSLAKYIGSTINVSPIKVDYAVGSMFGSWGRDVMTLSSGIDPDAPAQSWEDTVFLRRLIKDPARASDVTTKYWGFMGLTTGTYNQNVNTYDFLTKQFRDVQAQEFLGKLPASERAFVIMKSAADEDGKPAFSADQKRLHPLQRSYDAVTLLNGVRRELTDNSFKTFEVGQNVKLDPVARRDLNESIRELAQMEMRNAFVIMKEPGYLGRPLFDVKLPMDKIRAISPPVADEISTRYATAKIYTTASVAKAYPAMQSALVREGSQADLGALADDASASGYEFGGDRVRKPQKRRVPIAPSPTQRTSP